MEEFIVKLIPLALVGFGSLVGIGGNKWYRGRQNGNGNGNGWNGKDRRDYMTRTEISPELKSINDKLGEIKEDSKGDKETINKSLSEIKEDFKENNQINRETFKTVFEGIEANKDKISGLGVDVGRLQGAQEVK